MRRSITVLCLVLCLIALWLMRLVVQPKMEADPPTVTATPQSIISPVAAPKVKETERARKPLRITSKGKVRLKPGESAVLGYWEIAPGMNGMAIVTPETTPEGHVKMAAKLVQMSDAAVSEADAQDLFPDIFDFENYSAIDSDRLRGLQETLQSARGVDMLSAPTVLTRPGQQASISIGNSNEATLSLALQADPVAEDGGYDLSLELQRQE